MKITFGAVEEIRSHGVEGYPDEICGIMIGPKGDRTVTQVKRARNMIGDPRSRWPDLTKDRTRDRYEMDDRDQLRIEREADDAGMDVVGYYHSHPDHPAKASRFDAEGSYANYVYIIVSVAEGKAADLKAFVSDTDGGPFHPEPLDLI